MRLTRNVALLRRTLNELFHLLAARKLFLIRLRNLLNLLLRCGDIKVPRSKRYCGTFVGYSGSAVRVRDGVMSV